jgi:DNA-directed RNA polymerase subunit K/omega
VAAVLAPVSARLTKYERCALVGLRAEQLARGAQPFVDVPPAEPGQPSLGPCEIAERELDARRLPMIVVRHMPDGKRELMR